MTRAFDGTNDEIRCAIGACNITGAITMAIMVRRNSTSYNGLIGIHTSGGSATYSLELEGSGTIDFTGKVDVAGASLVNADGWAIVAATKAAGTVAPRAHRYRYTANDWVHANYGSTLADRGSAAGGTVRFGEWQDVDDFAGDMKWGAIWNRALSDAELEQLPFSIVHVLSLNPSGLWLFDQAATSQNVIDVTGNGANQTTLVGTTVGTVSAPIFSYGATVPLIIRPKAAAGGDVRSGATAWYGLGGLLALGAKSGAAAGALNALGSALATGSRLSSGNAASAGMASGLSAGTKVVSDPTVMNALPGQTVQSSKLTSNQAPLHALFSGQGPGSKLAFSDTLAAAVSSMLSGGSKTAFSDPVQSSIFSALTGLISISTLEDDFDDNTLNAQWIAEPGTGTVTEQNQRLELQPGSDAGSGPQLRSTWQYSLLGSAFSANLVQASGPSDATRYTIFRIQDGPDDFIQIVVSGGTMYFQKTLRAVTTDAGASIAYSSVTHAWLRFRESSGTVYWETSEDGSVWTERGSATLVSMPSISFDKIHVRLLTINLPGGTATATVFDSVNTTAGPIVFSGASVGYSLASALLTGTKVVSNVLELAALASAQLTGTKSALRATASDVLVNQLGQGLKLSEFSSVNNVLNSQTAAGSKRVSSGSMLAGLTSQAVVGSKESADASPSYALVTALQPGSKSSTGVSPSYALATALQSGSKLSSDGVAAYLIFSALATVVPSGVNPFAFWQYVLKRRLD